jgi:hypothetical protein
VENSNKNINAQQNYGYLLIGVGAKNIPIPLT